MDTETIKKKKIMVKFIVPDILPLKGLKRMQYYTCFADDPSKFYFGLSCRDSFDRRNLKDMAKDGKLIELHEPIFLNHDDDLWLDKEGQIILALAYEPQTDTKRRVIAAPKSLRKSHVILMKHLKTIDLPIISDSHVISE